MPKSDRARKPLFERLQRGLREGVAHVRGELTLRTVELPEEPPEIDGQTLAELRGLAGMSQAVFAKLLNVSKKTLQSWEQGVRRPADSSRRLIQVFSAHPEALCACAGLPAVTLEGVEVRSESGGRRRIVVRVRRLRARK